MTGEAFRELRSAAFSVAYRMTGSVSDAEDIAQEALLRLERVRRDGVAVDAPKAWLSTVATRLALDQLRSARVQREHYVGPWLPEPLIEDAEPGPGEHAELADSLSQAFLVLLETLSPVERAVFLLREVFGHDYADVACAVDRSEDNCRQIAARARRHLEARRPRFTADRRRADELLDRFLQASEEGDTDALKALLVEDAVMLSDGGGKAPAARRPIVGADRIARVMAGVTRKRLRRGRFAERRVVVNGQPGRILVAPDGSIFDVLTIDTRDDGIAVVRIIRNPEKLRHVARLVA